MDVDRIYMKFRGVRFSFLYVTSVLFFCVPMASSMASEEVKNYGNKTISIEYLRPTEDDRNINSVNIDFSALIAIADKLNLSIYAGVVGTYATGDITQLEGDINQGTLREVNYENSAFGAGPGVLLSFRLIEINRFSFNLNGSGHFVIYNKRFPAGGDYYNFMWRGGAVIEYKVENNKSIGVSYQGSHMSNGQGLSAENPSYEGSGFALRYTELF